jgi:hypothetical protein
MLTDETPVASRVSRINLDHHAEGTKLVIINGKLIRTVGVKVSLQTGMRIDYSVRDPFNLTPGHNHLFKFRGHSRPSQTRIKSFDASSDAAWGAWRMILGWMILGRRGFR